MASEELMRGLLWPLGKGYQALMAARNAAFSSGIFASYHSPLPVISVGNVTVGGSGKTPLTIYLAEQLRRLGHKPVVISRGYGGFNVQPKLVNRHDDSAEVGDEPLLMAQHLELPVVVARSRVAGAKFVESERLGDILLLDDGLQHRWLARALDIVTLFVGADARESDYRCNRVLPWGNLRESFDPALKRAQILICTSRSTNYPELPEWLQRSMPSTLALLRSRLTVQGIMGIEDGRSLAPQRVIVCTAIANPEPFIEEVRAQGYEPILVERFPDHARITAKTLSDLRLRAGNYPVVCTEKDAVKLKGSRNVYSMRTSLEVDRESELIQIIKGALSTYRLRKYAYNSNTKVPPLD